MAGMLLEISILLVLIAINGVLALSEIAVVAARKPRLRHMAGEGDEGAAVALALAESPNQFLSTVQVGITLVAILAGAIGGAAVAESVAEGLSRWGLTPGQAESIAFAGVVVAITFFTLVLGELVPKRLALNDPEGLSRRVARPMRTLARVSNPAVRVLAFSTDVVFRALRIPQREEPAVTEEEIAAMIAHATAIGVLEEREQEIVQRLFRLSDQTVAALMTPADRIVFLELEDSADEIRERIAGSNHTRYLVCRGGLDDVVGFVSVQDLLSNCLAGRPFRLRRLVRTPHRVPWWTAAFHLMELFQESGVHLALVIGERGQLQGLVTLTDVLEGMVGDLPESPRVEAPTAVQREDGSWLVDGLLPTTEFLALFEVPPAVSREAMAYRTVHGFIAGELPRPPVLSDVIRWHGLRIEVVDMDGSRIDKVLVSADDAPPAPSAPVAP